MTVFVRVGGYAPCRQSIQVGSVQRSPCEPMASAWRTVTARVEQRGDFGPRARRERAHARSIASPARPGCIAWACPSPKPRKKRRQAAAPRVHGAPLKPDRRQPGVPIAGQRCLRAHSVSSCPAARRTLDCIAGSCYGRLKGTRPASAGLVTGTTSGVMRVRRRRIAGEPPRPLTAPPQPAPWNSALGHCRCHHCSQC